MCFMEMYVVVCVLRKQCKQGKQFQEQGICPWFLRPYIDAIRLLMLRPPLRVRIMSDIAYEKAETQSPQAHLIQMATAHWVSRFLYVAALMNLADHLAERPKTAEELAPLTAAAAPSLYRLMRTLASLGLFTEDSSHRFSLTP